jgi:hypothetical protein
MELGGMIETLITLQLGLKEILQEMSMIWILMKEEDV